MVPEPRQNSNNMRRTTRLFSIGLMLLGSCHRDESEKRTPTSKPSPNVLLITIDTCRADRIGCYGFGLARTANIDRLAAEGVRCSDDATTAPITMPAHTSILTGLYPPAHGVRDNGAYALADEVTTLPERLKEAGYSTQAFVSAIVLNRSYNLTQGFDGYDDDLWLEDRPKLFMIRDRPAPKTAGRALSWLQSRAQAPDGKPFFMWVHFFDPHQPYQAKLPQRHLCPTPYDEEIAVVDLAVGSLIEELKKEGIFDNTVVIVTADHGESLGEHGEKTHAIFIYDATIHVPLIWRYPPLFPAGKVYDGPVRAVDIAPTILAILNLPGGDQTQGADLSKALRGDVPPLDLPQYCESLLCEVGFGMAPLYGVRKKGHKFIRAPRPELYDLKADPRELNNILAQDGATADDLDHELDAILADCKRRAVAPKENPLDKETAENLQALGYLGGRSERESMAGIDPKDGILLYSKLEEARHLAQVEKWHQSELLLREILEATPRNLSALNILALTLLRQNRIPECEGAYVESLRIDPNQHRVLHMLGFLKYRQGKLDEAEECYRKSLAITPRFVESMVHLGFVEMVRGRQDKAEEWYKKAIAEDPDFPRAQLQYADLFFLRNDYDNALSYYLKTLEAWPQQFDAVIQTGLCYQRKGDMTKAAHYYERARAIRPDSWLPVYDLACVEAVAGRNDKALTMLQDALKLGLADPDLVQTDEDLTGVRKLPAYPALLTKLLAAAKQEAADKDHE
jgi:arylsulfatase A-like enzyme/Tfp pilus assembly protein PilF